MPFQKSSEPKSDLFHIGSRGLILTSLLISALAASSLQAAEQCSPLQVHSVKVIDARPIIVNGKKAGVSARLRAIIHNTNPTRPYTGDGSTVEVFARDKGHSRSTLGRKHFKIKSHILGGRTTQATSERIDFEKYKNHHNIEMSAFARSLNEHCRHIKNPAVIMSEFQYDLTPVYNGQSPKYVRGRIQPWYTEAPSRPRPPRGPTTAPRPRPASSQAQGSGQQQATAGNNSPHKGWWRK